MSYPKKIELYKVSTREDAKHGQEHRFKSGTTIARGFMFETNTPKVGEQFMMFSHNAWPVFNTSLVEEVNEIPEGYYLKTVNSEYKVIIIDEK